jgi:hypothetical protein
MGLHREVAIEFDYDAVDDPGSVALDELNTMAARIAPNIQFTPDHVKVVMGWAATQGVGPSNPVLEYSALWLGGSADGDDVPLRAGVFIREFAPYARQAQSLRRLAAYHGSTRMMISKLARGLRAALKLPSCGMHKGVARMTLI